MRAITGPARMRARGAIVGVLGALVLAGTASAAAPVVTTLPVDKTLTSDTYALLSGNINPGGFNVVYHFEWGKTTAYGNKTPVTPAGNGKAEVPVDVALDTLKPNTTYHYRIVVSPAKSTGETGYLPDYVGGDLSFKTAKKLALTLKAKTFKVAGGKVQLKVKGAGPSGETAKGRLTLKAKLGGKSRKIGSVAFKVKPGKSKTLTVKLSARARKAVAGGKLKATASVKLSGVKKPITSKLTLKAATGARATAAAAKNIIGTGSSVAEPYMRALFAGYHKVKPSVKFIYTANGGNAGVKDVQQGRAQFAINTRPPLPSDSGTTYRQLFLDGLCIDVNTANSLTDISIASLGDIFLGTVTNWAQLPGAGLTTTIDPVGRDSTAGTYTFFQSAVLGGKSQGTNVNPVTSDGLVANAVSKDPNSIGYVGFAHSKGSGLKTLTVNGKACTPKLVKNQTYPLSRYIWFVSSSDKADAATVKFATWVRTSKAAGKILKKAGAVPAFNKK